MDYVNSFEDEEDFFHSLDNTVSILESIENYNTYVVHNTLYHYHLYNISNSDVVSMQRLIHYLSKQQLELLLESAIKFELYEFCSVINSVIKLNEKNSNYKISN